MWTYRWIHVKRFTRFGTMAFQAIKYKNRTLRPKKAFANPNFRAETVLVADPWDYVDLWLKRDSQDDARQYWLQAKEFASAATVLPPTSAPLPAYYSILNASKALLKVRGETVKDAHGVHGASEASSTSLDGEKVHFHTGGVLAGLCRLLGENADESEITLKQALYNLPFIHRAYTVTFTSVPELFIPVRNLRFVRKSGSKEAWFCAEVENRYNTKHTMNKLPEDWELDIGSQEPGTVRYKNRFKWNGSKPDSGDNQERLTTYHSKVRKHVSYIFGPQRLWYLKRGEIGTQYVKRSSLTLSFATMHRLSELSRYDPLSLRNHLNRQHNWLLTEFISLAVPQFIDEIAAEITGCDIMIPGIRK